MKIEPTRNHSFLTFLTAWQLPSYASDLGGKCAFYWQKIYIWWRPSKARFCHSQYTTGAPLSAHPFFHRWKKYKTPVEIVMKTSRCGQIHKKSKKVKFRKNYKIGDLFCLVKINRRKRAKWGNGEAQGGSGNLGAAKRIPIHLRILSGTWGLKNGPKTAESLTRPHLQNPTFSIWKKALPK